MLAQAHGREQRIGVAPSITRMRIGQPKQQQALRQVFFGATVTYARSDGNEHTVTLVGVDEADLSQGKVSWLSPVAQALMKAKVDDSVQLRTPSGVEAVKIVAIRYGFDARESNLTSPCPGRE